ncbi:hypothetical protein C0993_009531, partial [Termitomyces sp. T159_Od127]
HGTQANSEAHSAKEAELKETLQGLEAQIFRDQDMIEQLQVLVRKGKEERDRLLLDIEAMRPAYTGGSDRIDYTRKEFEWTNSLKAKMKDVFGIADFRLCQEGSVCMRISEQIIS